jgi:hypothetical protein
MFTAWNIPQRRTTLDIDLLARFDNQISSIEQVIRSGHCSLNKFMTVNLIAKRFGWLF